MNDGLSGTLNGVAVVALATNIPGPLAAARLHALGAAVLKVEPLRGDPLAEASARWYAAIHAGIDVVRLDLRAPADLATVHERLAGADVLITAMRGGAAIRAGLAWDDLHERYRRLSHVAIVGEAAPNDDRAGHDLTYQARSGLLSPPAMPRTVLSDLAAAERAVTAALAALFQRTRTGEGIRCEVAIVDAAHEFSAPLRFGLTGERDVLGGALPAYKLYPAKDGWVAVAALEPHFAQRLRELLGIDEIDTPSLERALLTRTAQEWEALAERHDVPIAAVVSGEIV